jgi:hypothetical protein
MKFILLILLYAGSLNAQIKQSPAYEKEKAKAAGLKMLVDSLKLTSSQSIALQKATNDFSANMQSLTAQKFTSQQRQTEIKRLLFLYHKELGQIFTPLQMDKYKSIEYDQQQKLRAKWDSQRRRGKLSVVEGSNN